MMLSLDAPARVLKIPETHILSRQKSLNKLSTFSFGGDGYHHPF